MGKPEERPLPVFKTLLRVRWKHEPPGQLILFVTPFRGPVNREYKRRFHRSQLVGSCYFFEQVSLLRQTMQNLARTSSTEART